MRIKKLMKFTALRKLRNLQGLCTPLDCMSSKTLLQESVLVELSASQGAFATCHLHWGHVSVKIKAVAWRSNSI